MTEARPTIQYKKFKRAPKARRRPPPQIRPTDKSPRSEDAAFVADTRNPTPGSATWNETYDRAMKVLAREAKRTREATINEILAYLDGRLLPAETATDFQRGQKHTHDTIRHLVERFSE